MQFTPKILGILNITPDSFSDGGLSGNIPAILNAAQKLIDEGADIIDIGAESTRPGATILTHDEEWTRLEKVLPEICKLAKASGVQTSIDTRHAATAAKAINCGIGWVNDVSGAGDAQMLEVLQSFSGKVVIMHNLGVPSDKNIIIPSHLNPVDEVKRWLAARLEMLENKGITRERVIIDPGIGFGKNAEQSWELIKHIAEFKDLGSEILVGHSRKSFLNSLSLWERAGVRGVNTEGAHLRDAATLEVSKQLAAAGVHYLRVHNVGIHK